MMRGKFISIEGTEGAGKSTILNYLQTYLTQKNIPLVVTREPGGTPIAEDIRQVLLHKQSDELMQPETELLLMFACRNQNIQHCIVPALAAGKWVISDRFVDASYAYQGGGRDIPIEKIEALDKLVVNGLYPDLTLLLDISPELGLARAEKRGGQKDRIEQERMDFFTAVRKAYLTRAAADSKRIKIIDASRSLSEVESQLQCVLDKFTQEAA